MFKRGAKTISNPVGNTGVFASVLCRMLFLPAAAIFSLSASARAEGELARVNLDRQSRIISPYEASRVFGLEEQQVREKFKGEEMIEKIRDLRRSAVQKLVDEALLLCEFEIEGRTIPEEAIDGQIDTIVRNQYGGNLNRLVEELRVQGYSLDHFRLIRRDLLALQEMRKHILETAAPETDPQLAEREWLEPLRKKARIWISPPYGP